MKQYSTDMLQSGDSFVVRGKTSYPHLTHVIEGQELQEEIQRATQQGRIPTSVPHTYTTLTDAAIEYANPNAPTMAELYAQERLFTNKDGKTCYTAIRKSSTLAEYGVIDANDCTKVQGVYLDPDKTLANGLDVKCYFRVFDTKAGMHKGISLDAIVFQEPIKYYEFSNASGQLAARGLTWNAPEGPAPQPQNPAYSAPVNPAQQVTPAYGQQTPQNAAPVQSNVYGGNVPNQPVAPAYGQPVAPATQPQAQPQAPAYGQPVAPAQQAQSQAPQAPAYGQPVSPAVQSQATQAPTYGQPAAPAQQAQTQQAQAPQAPAYGQPVAPATQPQQEAPAQQIGNTGASAFDGAYNY